MDRGCPRTCTPRPVLSGALCEGAVCDWSTFHIDLLLYSAKYLRHLNFVESPLKIIHFVGNL